MANLALPLPRRLPTLGVSRPRHRLGASALAVSWIGAALLFATAALSVYLVQISAVANAGYDLQRLEMERKGWLARNEQLELELAKRRSLAWVEAQAVQRLGMARADKAIYLQVTTTHTAGEEGEVASHPAASRDAEKRRTESRSERPEPGNPARAIDAIQAWLAVPASR